VDQPAAGVDEGAFAGAALVVDPLSLDEDLAASDFDSVFESDLVPDLESDFESELLELPEPLLRLSFL
jgi:hypothetical protein